MKYKSYPAATPAPPQDLAPPTYLIGMGGSFMAPPFPAPAEANSPHLALLEQVLGSCGMVAGVVFEPQETS